LGFPNFVLVPRPRDLETAAWLRAVFRVGSYFASPANRRALLKSSVPPGRFRVEAARAWYRQMLNVHARMLATGHDERMNCP
jgi:hypothetical protein